MSGDTIGRDLLDIANSSWNDRKKRYQGWQYLIAVGKAKAGIEKTKGPGAVKARRQEAEHQVNVLLTHARNQTPATLQAVAYEAGLSNGSGQATLNTFAAEVCWLLNGDLDAGFGAADPAMIIGLIVAIVNAIKACQQVVPVPQPT